jgi:hypothetical protein
VKKSFNLELLNGISVLITLASLAMVTGFLLPSTAHRAPVSDAPAALASGSLPPPAAIR